jgi:hypothetical protein
LQTLAHRSVHEPSIRRLESPSANRWSDSGSESRSREEAHLLLRWENSSAAEEAQKRLQELHRDGESNLRFPIIPTRVLILFEAFVSMITCSANNEARCGFDEIYVRGPGGFQSQRGSKPCPQHNCRQRFAISLAFPGPIPIRYATGIAI